MKAEETVEYYIPAEDEPSPFGGLHDNPSEEWVYWYRYNFKDSGNPFIKGKELIERLNNEKRARDFSRVDKVIIKNAPVKEILLDDVITLSYLKGFSFQETHDYIKNLTGDRVEVFVKPLISPLCC